MTVKVKLLVSRAGDNFSQPYGSVVDVDVAEARRLLAVNQAVLEPGEELPELDETEEAKGETKEPDGETATKPKRPRRSKTQ